MGAPVAKRISWLAVVLAVAALTGFGRWSGERHSHTVTRVFDGDTILMDDGRKVRLAGVDAPEVDSAYTEGEPCGAAGREYLKALVEGRRVVLRKGSEPFDPYGRTLAMVYLGDVLVNGRIIRDGWARAYRRFDYPFKDLFIAYEKEARSKGIGMWRECRGMDEDSPVRKRR
jgi:micrococcal nuclease